MVRAVRRHCAYRGKCAINPQTCRAPKCSERGGIMARGSKSKYSGKQKRKAEHIEEGYEKRGTSKQEAERRAWATVNKETGGGKRSGTGRGKATDRSSSRKGGRIGGSSQSHATRVRAGKKAARTRARRGS